jgi:hypothetical protein
MTLPLAKIALATALLAPAMGCGPQPNIPPRPSELPNALPTGHPTAQLARRLAPTLYLHHREWFRLERVVAVAHPTRPVIAYHLLWEDDVHGAWAPLTKATDQEIVWVTYDERGRPTDLWTYWHRLILHTPWGPDARPAVDVQWGKHGSLPRGTVLGDLPASRGMGFFYALTWVGLPDILLGTLTRPGPRCFCAGPADYRDFSRELPLSESIDVVLATDNPLNELGAVFGLPYSRKPAWPWLGAGRDNPLLVRTDGGAAGRYAQTGSALGTAQVDEASADPRD